MTSAPYKHLTDDEADVLSDAIGLVAVDEDPVVARARMRWIARAYGTPFGPWIERCSWGACETQQLSSLAPGFLRSGMGDEDQLPGAPGRRWLARFAVGMARSTVSFLPEDKSVEIGVRRAGEEEEEQVYLPRRASPREELEIVEAWLAGTVSDLECRAVRSRGLLVGDSLRRGPDEAQKSYLAWVAAKACFDALSVVVLAGDAVQYAAGAFESAIRALDLPAVEARDLLFRSAIEAWWAEHPITGASLTVLEQGILRDARRGFVGNPNECVGVHEWTEEGTRTRT